MGSSSNGAFRIVVGVDGSESAQAAMDWAVDEARLRNGRVVALSAWHYPYVSDALGQVWEYQGFEDDARAVLDQELERVGNRGAEVTGSLIEGNPASALVDASQQADLVVVGSHGRGGFTGMLLGSVSMQTVHHAHCPVLVVRGGPPATTVYET
ncbi:universal stress protein [Arthrobacter sp. SO3]|uniref:universal stress protein n=1 Tax=Arthrobacter sp. SO3 TaxID=1897057 RepID=UPI001CFF8660|nr:universal stress protein [Arthrobacter sp. SO3]MCB5292660.1 Universal stress protein [Arthrobacter sp. SO3]